MRVWGKVFPSVRPSGEVCVNVCQLALRNLMMLFTVCCAQTGMCDNCSEREMLYLSILFTLCDCGINTRFTSHLFLLFFFLKSYPTMFLSRPTDVLHFLKATWRHTDIPFDVEWDEAPYKSWFVNLEFRIQHILTKSQLSAAVSLWPFLNGCHVSLSWYSTLLRLVEHICCHLANMFAVALLPEKTEQSQTQF